MGALVIGCRWDRDLILAAGGEMAAAAMAHRYLMVYLLWLWAKCSRHTCDALIWTLCHQDVRIVGFFEEIVRSSVDKISFYLSQNV
jgi:hypothetical protein